MNRETVAVLDFETTGLSPNCGDRATEIAITLVRDGQVIDRYQSLMNAGRRIPSEVTYITGITNAMISQAPPVVKVMRDGKQVGELLPGSGFKATMPLASGSTLKGS